MNSSTLADFRTNLVIAGPDYFGWATSDVPEYADKPPESLIKFHNAASGPDRRICPMLATIRLDVRRGIGYGTVRDRLKGE